MYANRFLHIGSKQSLNHAPSKMFPLGPQQTTFVVSLLSHTTYKIWFGIMAQGK